MSYKSLATLTITTLSIITGADALSSAPTTKTTTPTITVVSCPTATNCGAIGVPIGTYLGTVFLPSKNLPTVGETVALVSYINSGSQYILAVNERFYVTDKTIYFANTNCDVTGAMYIVDYKPLPALAYSSIVKSVTFIPSGAPSSTFIYVKSGTFNSGTPSVSSEYDPVTGCTNSPTPPSGVTYGTLSQSSIDLSSILPDPTVVIP